MNKSFAFILSGLLIVAGCAVPARAETDVDAAAVTVKADGLKDGLKEGLKDGYKKERPDGMKEGMKDGLKYGLKDGLKNGPKKTTSSEE